MNVPMLLGEEMTITRKSREPGHNTVDPRRRHLTQALVGASAIGALTACGSPSERASVRYQRPFSTLPFSAPRITRDRVVREVIGHRPYRPTGFVVKREQFDAKTVVHNYGHGGGGISLAWGSSALALRQVTDHLPARGGSSATNVAVLGAGIMGLTTARLLQQAGLNVTIYSRDPSRHAVSNVGGGQWAATSVFDYDRVDDTFLAQYRWASQISHHAYQNLVGAGYGVGFIENYYLGDEPLENGPYLKETPELFQAVKDLAPGEHPFPTRFVKRTVTMLIQPAQFLRRVTADFLLAGGKFVAKNFVSISEVLSLAEPLIFNCTGLGAKALFGDEDLTPAKGQLVFLLPDPAVDYLSVGGHAGSGVTYMFPRTGEILLGGSFEPGNWTRTVDPDVTERILADNKRVYDQFG